MTWIDGPMLLTQREQLKALLKKLGKECRKCEFNHKSPLFSFFCSNCEVMRKKEDLKKEIERINNFLKEI